MTTMQIANEAYKLKQQYGADAPVAPSRLIAARRDSVAFQVIVNADSIYSVNVARGDWYSSRGGRRPGNETGGPHQRLRVAVDAPFAAEVRLVDMHTDDDGNKKADALLTQTVRESDANNPSAVWVELQIPEDATPGDYTVTARLFAAHYNEDETLVQTVTLPLRVYPFVLPAPRDWSFYLDLWQHNSNLARKHDVPLWSDEHFAVMEKYVASLANLGQKAITVCASQIPWSGQSCFLNQEFGGNLFEYSIISIIRRKDGSFFYDYSAMQRYIDLCTSYGISGEIEVFGLVNLWAYDEFIAEPLCADYPEPIRLRYFDEADGSMKYIRDAEQVKDYIASLEQYFIKTSQIERVRIVADEPADINKYRRSLEILSEIAPSFCFKTAINHFEFIEEFGERIRDIVPRIDYAARGHAQIMRYRAAYPEKRVLFYVCTGRSRPNTFLRHELTEARMIPAMVDLFGFDGFLRWNYTIWPEDPRRDIRFSRFEAGDVNFVYPAYNGDVLLSLRYKNLRRGIADFEIARAVEKKCGKTSSESLFSRLLYIKEPVAFYEATKKGGIELHTHDWEQFNTLKAEMLALLAE